VLAELKSEDAHGFRNYMRISAELFEEVLQRVGPRLMKKDTFMRKALEPYDCLVIALSYFATGDSYKSLLYSFRVAHNTISCIVSETCEAIKEEFMEEVMTCPSPPDELKQVAEGISERWNFHNICRAVDGKYVAINFKCSPKGGSKYINNKKFHSLILMALVDSNYRFLYVSLGAAGSASDGGVFSLCSLGEALEGGFAGLPEPEPLPLCCSCVDNRPHSLSPFLCRHDWFESELITFILFNNNHDCILRRNDIGPYWQLRCLVT
jgi:hypothetical protein